MGLEAHIALRNGFVAPIITLFYLNPTPIFNTLYSAQISFYEAF